jgi:hypothetical protein
MAVVDPTGALVLNGKIVGYAPGWSLVMLVGLPCDAWYCKHMRVRV